MYTICCGERKFLFVYLVAYVFLVIDNEIIVLGKTCLSRILRFWSSVSSTRSTRGSQILYEGRLENRVNSNYNGESWYGRNARESGFTEQFTDHDRFKAFQQNIQQISNSQLNRIEENLDEEYVFRKTTKTDTNIRHECYPSWKKQMSILIRPLSTKKTSSQPSQASQKVLNLWKIDKILSSWQIRVDSWKRVWIKSDCGRFGRRKENVPSPYQSGKEGQRRDIFKTKNLKICAIL